MPEALWAGFSWVALRCFPASLPVVWAGQAREVGQGGGEGKLPRSLVPPCLLPCPVWLRGVLFGQAPEVGAERVHWDAT
ncbi:hypothetical protein GCM10012275_61110 [Longimycelium tulufanense]|uniref:Uncharacterized protein n=1 Tax=Longimycelium tulufanense TaxID=907463 RepID=A0A8J3CKY7_9PSEU|nr:hypothetical protein GCM10012275_61110 [Longimycelium tulufanense]